MMTPPRKASGTFTRYAGDYARDGVTLVKQALGEQDLTKVEKAFLHVLGRPLADMKEPFFSVSGYFIDDPVVRDAIEDTALADIASGVFGGGPVWYVGNQLLLRQGEADRTYWHQDTAYAPYNGSKSAVLWVTLESIALDGALEIVRGSHSGPTYNIFYSDDRAPDSVGAYYDDDWDAPLIPEIQKERDKWNIFSAATSRGDVLVFHENSVHGGAPTFAGQRRRTMSFRYAGDDVLYIPRPPMRDRETEAMAKRMQGDRYHQAFEGLKAGEPICRSPLVTQVRA
jgi:hypothetical protein